MKTCPRCRRKCLEDESVLNSRSHYSDIEICSECGKMEGLVKLGENVPKSEIMLTEEFLIIDRKGKNGS